MRLICLLALCLWPTFSGAASERAEFDVFVAGLKAGHLALTGQESAGRYSVQGTARSAGIAAGLRRFTVAASARGSLRGNRYRSQGYAETLNDKKGTTKRQFRYAGDRLEVTRSAPDTGRKSHHLSPDRQGDTLDPLTAVWALFRDRPAALACDLSYESYNGRQRAALRLSGGRRDGDRFVCAGQYRRVAGYSQREMSKQRQWAFTLTYRIAPDLYHVEALRLKTQFGTMTFRRR